MMGGYGRGFGTGPGMANGVLALDLTEAQRKQVLAVKDETRKKNWTTMGAMHDEMAKLRDAMSSGERDRAKITAASKRMAYPSFGVRQAPACAGAGEPRGAQARVVRTDAEDETN
jgi:Spy/CpxP family protein refolding chaperone